MTDPSTTDPTTPSPSVASAARDATTPVPPVDPVSPVNPVASAAAPPPRRLVLVGSPNVGKSLLFNNLTGAYATVSNYPGTTVELTRGTAQRGGVEWEVIDTPGMYALLPTSEEERVGRAVLREGRADVVLHVVDAKNLERMLSLTLQFLEAGLPLILVLNVMDEAEERGIAIDAPRLSRDLGIPVIPAVSTTGRGIPELWAAIEGFSRGARTHGVKYHRTIEHAVAEIEKLLPPHDGLTPRSRALLLLQGDTDREGLPPDVCARITDALARFRRHHSQPAQYAVATQRQRMASQLAARVMTRAGRPKPGMRERLNDLLINPWTGAPILLLALYIGLYKFVGGFGAGMAVDFLDKTVFGEWINPVVHNWTARVLTWPPLHELVAGEYGLITLGLRYAVAIVLPIVGFFFVVFAIMEDTGYLPRLALLIDRIFKRIGLSGRGVIPIVLGLGCDTMATMVTRTLPTARERLIATLLLALAVPCSAQLGLILALLHDRPAALAVWTAVLVLVFLLVGFLSARLMPGESPRFYMELPPLRWPTLGNVFLKTYTRIVWYLKEVIPLFLAASVLIWLGQLSGVFAWATRALETPVRWIGLPADAAQVFLFGFFRRDYGAAGLYDLEKAGAMTGVQLTVAAVALTLFLPCVAQFLMNVKERGWKQGVAISVFILFFSFTVAFLVNALLTGLGVVL